MIFFAFFLFSGNNIKLAEGIQGFRGMEDYSFLEKFIRENYAAVCAVAERFVDRDTAQDIAQNVLFKFWENREKYAEVESLDDFLFIMVRNEAISYLRSRKTESERHEVWEGEREEERDVFHALVEEETNQLLLHAISLLPEQTAHVIRLVLSGYSNKEIALLVNVSINTVKTLKYGGIRKLREYFESRKF